MFRRDGKHAIPPLSEIFVVSKRRTLISKQVTARLSLKDDLGKRKPSPELPSDIKVSAVDRPWPLKRFPTKVFENRVSQNFT